MSQPRAQDSICCSFCGKSNHEVERLLAGNAAFICDECVELCVDIIALKRQEAILYGHDMIVGDDSR